LFLKELNTQEIQDTPKSTPTKSCQPKKCSVGLC